MNEHDPPHVREDYREVWASGYRAGQAAAEAERYALKGELKTERDAYEKMRANYLHYAKKAEQLAAACDALRASLEPLQAFARDVLKGYEDGEVGDIDGGWLEDRALELGLLVASDGGDGLFHIAAAIAARPSADK